MRAQAIEYRFTKPESGRLRRSQSVKHEWLVWRLTLFIPLPKEDHVGLHETVLVFCRILFLAARPEPSAA
jgi:hypothetical protein